MTPKQKIDAAVDAFAKAMKQRLHEKRLCGYTGWDDPRSVDGLRLRLINNASRTRDQESMVDAANIAMMYWADAAKKGK